MARDARHPRPGRGRLPRAASRSADGHLGLQLRTTCTPGRSCSSPASGWVRFEPTPVRPGRGRARRTPTQNLPQLPEPAAERRREPPAGQQPSLGQNPRPDEGVRRGRSRRRATRRLPVGAGARRGRRGAGPGAAPAAPRTVRRRRPARRADRLRPEAAWAELRDDRAATSASRGRAAGPRETRDRAGRSSSAPPIPTTTPSARATAPSLTRRRGRAGPARALPRAAALLPRPAGRRRGGGRGRRHPDRAERAPRRAPTSAPGAGPAGGRRRCCRGGARPPGGRHRRRPWWSSHGSVVDHVG